MPELANALAHLNLKGSRGVRVDIKYLHTKKRSTIPLFHFQCPGAEVTVLWSHANAMDVGEMYFFFLELAARLKVAGIGGRGGGTVFGFPLETTVLPISTSTSTMRLSIATHFDSE